MEDCDKRINAVLKALTKGEEEPAAKSSGKRIYHNAPGVDDLDKMMIQLFEGEDLRFCQVLQVIAC